MTGDLELYRASSIAERKAYAWALAAAGTLLPRAIRGGDERAIAAKVFLLAETGAMLGIHPLAALQGVNVIDGKPTISPGLASALARGAGHKLRIRHAGAVETGNFRVTVTLIRSDDTEFPFEDTWTVERGVRAGLCTYSLDPETGRWIVQARDEYGAVQPWETYTEAMVEHRCVIAVVRRGAEELLMGIHYTPEEMGAAVDAEGEVIQLTQQANGSHAVAAGPQNEAAPAAAAAAFQEAREPRPPAPTTYDAHVAEVWLEEVRQADLHENPREALLSVWRRCGNTGNLQRPAFDPEIDGAGVLTLDSLIREAAEHAIERMERAAAEAEHPPMALDTEAPPEPTEPPYDYDETPF